MSSPEGLRFVEITDINDDLLLPWLRLYEISFPPEERCLVSSHLRILKEQAKGEHQNSHSVAALDDSDKLVGLMAFDIWPELCYLLYLAVDPESRGRGIGGACHDEVLRRCRESTARLAIMEVELPEESPDADFSRGRIEFYRRHGALLLTGIRYISSAGSHKPDIPMQIMIVPFEPITPQEAFEIAREWFGEEAVTQVGDLALD